MPAKYARPYSKGQKNDFRDPAADSEVVIGPADQPDDLLSKLVRYGRRPIYRCRGLHPHHRIRRLLEPKVVCPSWGQLKPLPPAHRQEDGWPALSRPSLHRSTPIQSCKSMPRVPRILPRRGVSPLRRKDSLENTLTQGDVWFASLKKRMDDYAKGHGLSREGPPDETAPEPPPWSQPITELELKSAGIASVVWCSGFNYDFSWVTLPVLNDW